VTNGAQVLESVVLLGEGIDVSGTFTQHNDVLGLELDLLTLGGTGDEFTSDLQRAASSDLAEHTVPATAALVGYDLKRRVNGAVCDLNKAQSVLFS
jgi:hypothetical protein